MRFRKDLVEPWAEAPGTAGRLARAEALPPSWSDGLAVSSLASGKQIRGRHGLTGSLPDDSIAPTYASC